MFGYRVGFSGTADLMTLFSIRTNSRWRPPPSWIIFRMAISPQQFTIYLYSTHRAVIFAIAQLSCNLTYYACYVMCLVSRLLFSGFNTMTTWTEVWSVYESETGERFDVKLLSHDWTRRRCWPQDEHGTALLMAWQGHWLRRQLWLGTIR